MSRLHYGLSFLMWLEFCISAINGVSRRKRGVYIKKGTTGEKNFWLNKSYKPKLHLFSLAAPCYLVASFNRILYFQVPALHHVLTNTHRSLLGKGSGAKGTVTHHCQVRGAMMLHPVSGNCQCACCEIVSFLFQFKVLLHFPQTSKDVTSSYLPLYYLAMYS